MSLEKGRIRLYLADIRPLYQEEKQRQAYARLDEARRKKADAAKQPGARAASLAAGLLAQYALQQNGFGGYRIVYGEKGQPQVYREHFSCEKRQLDGAESKGQHTEPEIQEKMPFLSLSHSGDYAVCAIADRPIGVDIQKQVPIRTGMLRHFFSEEERKRFAIKYGLKEETGKDGMADGFAKTGKGDGFLPKDAAGDFLRLWTAKESYMKLTGIGMALGFPRILADLETGRICGTGMAQDNSAECLLKEYAAPEGYFLTACISEETA